ncbi:vomeronasal type-2 receptor 26-like [Rana temporaria]|uniref:vomeronasal type-2 receptor 26-like n=1 Tax=Rana temporaria TaxID=8407 RepID=UPI001AAC4921|nr:vomeronasal type-2 receptor 26-like [Rana temporaria]
MGVVGNPAPILPSSDSVEKGEAAAAKGGNPVPGDCGEERSCVDFEEYRCIMAMMFAVNEINLDPDLLPNITLGYHIFSTCNDPKKTLGYAAKILSGINEAPNYYCKRHGEVAGFIGDTTFLSNQALAQLLSLYRYTQINYQVTDPFLSDGKIYPTLFRMTPDDRVRFAAIIKLLQHFGWNWVGIMTSRDSGGDEEAQELSKMMREHGICTEYIIQTCLGVEHNVHKVRIIRESAAKVVIVCGTFSKDLLSFSRRIPSVINKITFILPQSWVKLSSHFFDNTPINCSFLFLWPEKGNININMHGDGVNFSSCLDDPLLEDFWIYGFRCLSPNLRKNDYFQTHFKDSAKPCTHVKDLSLLFHGYTALPSFVYTAVYILANALHFMYMKKNTSEQNGFQHRIPVSRCSDPCLPGNRKKFGSSIHICCYECVSCPEGEISNISDSENCMKCPDEEWPNEKKDRCVPRVMEFLSYTDDPIVGVFSAVSILCCLLTGLILGIFIHYRDTPIVKANNRDLSYLLLVSIMLSFLCVFLFLGHLVDVTCMLRVTSFGVIFSVAVSSLLAKSIMVCIAFKATKPGSPWRKWMGAKLPNFIICVFSLVQVIICVTWLSISPPFQDRDTHSYQGKIIIQCNEGSVIGFYSVLGYMGLLATVSFIIAFLARTLPDSFNEAKYITFSMLVFCSVWIAMIPAYMSTRGKYMVAVEVFAIMASSSGLLGCIFFPKCYIILFRPDLNTKAAIH